MNLVQKATHIVEQWDNHDQYRDFEKQGPPAEVTLARQLLKIFAVVDKYDEEDAGEWPDDIDGRSGGNFDDAFSMGVNYGEAVLAVKIQKLLTPG